MGSSGVQPAKVGVDQPDLGGAAAMDAGEG
jgi:hypothetical protein